MVDKRKIALAGGILAGLGLGSCLLWSLSIFETAHPELMPNNDGTSTSLYPGAAASFLIVMVASLAFGLGLSLIGVALIRDEPRTQLLADQQAASSAPDHPSST